MNTDDHNSNHLTFNPELLQQLEYDIKVIESDNVASQQARKLVINPEYRKNTIQFRRHKDTLLIIPIADVVKILTVSNIRKRFGRERNSVIRLVFSGLGITTERSIKFDVKNVRFVNVFVQQIKLLNDAEGNQSLQKAILTTIYLQLCNRCLEKILTFEFRSIGKVCLSCFEKEYGKLLHQTEANILKDFIFLKGGHKDHIPAKKIRSKQALPGNMYLTENYFIFAKEDKDFAKRWEIIIPLESVISNWSLEEKERQRYIEWEGTSINNFAFGSGFIHTQNKGVRLVIPYVDNNGSSHEPGFILTSLIMARIWAAKLYKQIAKANTTITGGGLLSGNRSKSNNNNTIQTTANCINCGREFEIYHLVVCNHCILPFCDICIINHFKKGTFALYAKYLGGHKLYPKSENAWVYFYSDRIEIPKIHLRVPYTTMSNLENADEKNITAKRLFLVGLLAFGWKKKDVYTIIEYLDGFNQKQVLVFDFEDHVQEAQQFIYERMMASRFAKDKLSEGVALEDNATTTNNQKSLQENVTNTKPNENFDKASVNSHVSELPEINKSRDNDNDNVEPLHILKIRFAKGEINKEQYEEMRKMLE
jgi:hypothetical protein